MNLDLKMAMYFRDQFREARATALRDAEGFQEILFVLERFGAYLTRKIGTLATYKKSIKEAALISPLADCIPTHCQSSHVPFSRLYELVSNGRNDALHRGAVARHLTGNAVQLALVLEDALMSNQNMAGDYMVRGAVRAFFWQPLSFIRQTMLAKSFTYLPVWRSPDWLLVSDYHVARYLREGREGCRKAKLAMTLEEAGKKCLHLEKASTCFADCPIDKVLEMSGGKPVLVVEEEQAERLLGIVTPFDLL